MLREYAFDPELLGRFGVAWQALEQIGVHQGRVIASFPKTWTKLVYDAMLNSNCPDVEKKALVERLNRLKESVVSLHGGRIYAGSNWGAAACAANQVVPFDAVITEADVAIDNRIRLLELNAENPLWEVSCKPIARSAESLSAVLGPLGRLSRRFLFVDPYIDDKVDRLRLIGQVLLASQVFLRNIDGVEFHVSKRAGCLTQLASAIHRYILSDGRKVREFTIFKWDQKSNGDRMHPRYFLTDRGGIRIDYGFDVGNPGETTDVALLDLETYEQRWSDYQRETSAFNLIESFDVNSL